MEQIRTAAIIAKINNDEARQASERIAKLLTSNKIKIYTLLPLQLHGSLSVTQDELKRVKLDLIFAIGGDGTTLRAFRTLPGDSPLVSMNIGGHRGMLSDVEISSIDRTVSAIFSGTCLHESRVRLQPFIGRTALPPVLNDILITRTNLTRTPEVSLNMMGDEIKQRMDGMVVSTATGSTGHSFSIGGPILYEGLACLLVCPIAPVNRMPPLVTPLVDVMITSSLEMTVIVDGQETFTVKAGEAIKVSRYPHDAHFLRLQRSSMRQLAKLGF